MLFQTIHICIEKGVLPICLQPHNNRQCLGYLAFLNFIPSVRMQKLLQTVRKTTMYNAEELGLLSYKLNCTYNSNLPMMNTLTCTFP